MFCDKHRHRIQRALFHESPAELLASYLHLTHMHIAP